MKLYIDANFILQDALMQEQLPAIAETKVLIRSHALELRCPVVAFVEAVTCVSHRHAWRDDYRRLVEQHPSIRDLVRSRSHLQTRQKQKEVVDYLMEIRSKEEQHLKVVLDGLLEEGELLPVTSATFSTAMSLQREHEFRLADALIVASVLIDIEGQRDAQRPFLKSLFISGDKRLHPVKKDLESINCALIQNFQHAVEFIKHSVTSK